MLLVKVFSCNFTCCRVSELRLEKYQQSGNQIETVFVGPVIIMQEQM